MTAQPDRVNKMKEDINSRKPKKDFNFMLKRVASLSQPLNMKPQGYMRKDKKPPLKKKK